MKAADLITLMRALLRLGEGVGGRPQIALRVLLVGNKKEMQIQRGR